MTIDLTSWLQYFCLKMQTRNHYLYLLIPYLLLIRAHLYFFNILVTCTKKQGVYSVFYFEKMGIF